jgi:hypothetical protein
MWGLGLGREKEKGGTAQYLSARVMERTTILSYAYSPFIVPQVVI